MTLPLRVDSVKLWWWSLLVGLCLVGFLLFFRPDRLTLAGAFVGALAVVICLVVIIQYFTSPVPQGLPFFAGMAFFYLVAFAIQPFLVDFIWDNGSDIRIYVGSPEVFEFNADNVSLIFVGIVSLFSGFIFVQSHVRHWIGSRHLVADLSCNRQTWLAWVCILAHVAWVLLPNKYGAGALDKLLIPLGFFGFGLSFLLAVKGRLPKYHIIIIFGILLPLRIYAGISIGAAVMVLIVPASILFIFATVNRRLFIYSVATLSAFTAVFYPFFVTYRSIMAWEVPSPSLERRIEVLAVSWRDMTTKEIVQKNGDMKTEFEDDKFARVFRHVARRLNQAVVLSVVKEKTPSVVPYWQGKTLLQVVTSPIPRLLWPEKPKEVLGSWFGKTYGFIDSSDLSMSVNLPWLVEAYANFGWYGIVGVMLLCGAFLGTLDATLNRPGGSPVEIALAGAVMFPLINQESNISLTMGGTINFLICAVTIIKVASVRIKSK